MRRLSWRWFALPVACTIVGIWLARPEGEVTIRFDGWKEGTVGRKACFTVLNESRRRVTVAETYIGKNTYWAMCDFAFKWKWNELAEQNKLTITTASTGVFWNMNPPAPMKTIAPHGSQKLEVELWQGVRSVDFAVVPGVVWTGWEAEDQYARFPAFIRKWLIHKAVRESAVRDPKYRIRVELPGAQVARVDSFWDTPALTGAHTESE